ncbi:MULTISPECIES: hypothetical protein [Providencia]|uniref:Uncharacterized protein n=2 Tax=Providencia TaxID=586 RepID=A0A2X2DEY5_PRORE|nr:MULTISPECIES: hypothetical protein [Providencia]MRF66283.1 hypothetical protein [Escherichia coli]EFE52239.1 hypothetical protein PROVRETT_09032 [Providencia rettgeri DSM 1131]EHZ6874287.1 hypothetical protein [Providencia rettgeri]MBG5891102.1 hypothetical protein [Providencia rettgeri]MBG5926901.1 hypothetical protein [Providencia rettgeri]
MPATDPIELIFSLLANTIKMVITPTEYLIQSDAIGDAIYISLLFLN